MDKQVLAEVKRFSGILKINLKERGKISIKDYFAKKADWSEILCSEKLSESFIHEFIGNIMKELKKENKKLKQDVKKWNDRWFSQREIIGWLGYNNLPDSYKDKDFNEKY